MPLTVRQATPADVPTLVDFNCRLAAESEDKSLDPATVTAGVIAAMGDPDRKGPYYLACDGDQVLGGLQITFEWSDWRNGWFWWIQGVYVLADARRRGVFRTLYEHVERLARANPEVIALRLYVETENVIAQKTYADMGMEQMSYFMLHKPLRLQGDGERPL